MGNEQLIASKGIDSATIVNTDRRTLIVSLRQNGEGKDSISRREISLIGCVTKGYERRMVNYRDVSNATKEGAFIESYV